MGACQCTGCSASHSQAACDVEVSAASDVEILACGIQLSMALLTQLEYRRPFMGIFKANAVASQVLVYDVAEQKGAIQISKLSNTDPVACTICQAGCKIIHLPVSFQCGAT